MIVFKKNWKLFKWSNYFYINLSNPKKTLKKLKGVFKPLKCYFRFGKTYNPVLWCSKPSFIHIVTSDVQWKDKWHTPRYESPPYVWIHIYKWNLVWYWDLQPHQTHLIDQYWEQALWYLYYYGNISYGKLDSPDISKAKESWPWQNLDGTSSWEDKFLVKNETER